MKLKELLEKRAALMAQVDDADEKRFAEIQLEARKLDMQIEEARKAEAPTEEPVAARTAAVNEPAPAIVIAGMEGRVKTEPGMEYRKAFMDFVTRGVEIPAEVRAGDENTLTTDIPGAIPTVLVDKIIEKMESTGMILPLVTKTAYKYGMAIPASSVKPVATWVGEGEGSDKQKKVTANITFGAFKLRCEISMSLEVGVMALPTFEAAFIANVSEAMVKKLEATIVSAEAGTASPKGILAETVATGHNVNVAHNGAIAYTTLTDAEGLLPSAYDASALWFMTKKTYMGFEGMVDELGHPIARTNYGLAARPERMLLGRRVIINDYQPNLPLTTPDVDTVFAFLFDPSDYILNTVYDMGVQRKQDWDTEDNLAKAVWLVDGKVGDKNSLVTVTKKAS